MKRWISVALFFAALLTMGISFPGNSNAGVDVNIYVPLPPLVVPAPPGLVVIPGTYVYFAPDVDVDIFFFHGYWYRPYEGRWYRSDEYNGQWRYVPAERVPRAVINLPPAYRGIPSGHERVPYGQVRKNWRTWEREGRWDNGEGGRGEHGKGRERGRGRHGEGED
jgi:hypothetical protein